MVISLLLTVVLIAAVASTAARRAQRARLRRAGQTRAGAAPDLAIAIRSYTEIEEHLSDRWCAACGGYLERRGEGSREDDGRRFRVVRLACQECEAEDVVYFETTDVLH